MSERLLIVEDEDTLRESLCRVFEREGYEVTAVGGAEAALELFEEDAFDLVITDIILPGITGIELIKRMKEAAPDQPSIVMTAYASLETAVETLRAGAYDYIVKPIIHEEMKQTVRNALRMRALQEENVSLKKQMGGPFDMGRIIGEHPEMIKIKQRAKQAAAARTPVLLVGEVGTGKKLIARAIHDSGASPVAPFSELNCAALGPTRQDEMLFGNPKGPAPIPTDRQRGIFPKSKLGTVYLKKIESLSLENQEKILRILQGGEIHPPGEGAPIRMDALVISGTEGEPEALVAEGKFHKELYGLLRGSEFRLPPLRERGPDIDGLADFFLERYRRSFGKWVKGLATEVRQRFQSYPWPGNVLELRNLMERAVLLTQNDRLESADFPSLFRLC